MIDWLSSWLREIILIILLAIFIDLLLPNSSMQRYVKVVISLFILLAIISPIISLLRSDIKLDPVSIATSASGQIQTVDSIMEEGERLNILNEQYSIEFIEEQIAEQMKSQLSQVLDESVHRVEVHAVPGDDTNGPRITYIQVALEPVGAEMPDTKRTSDQWVDLEPIEPVHIQITLDEPYQQEGQQDNHRQAHLQEVTEQVHHILTQHWHITMDVVEVIYLTEQTNE